MKLIEKRRNYYFKGHMNIRVFYRVWRCTDKNKYLGAATLSLPAPLNLPNHP